MNNDNFEDLITAIADHYGFAKQATQTMEECAELIQAITKLHRALRCGYDTPVTPQDAKDRIVEEIADVFICVTQLCYLLGCGEQVDEIINYKLNRQLERIKNKAPADVCTTDESKEI